MKLDRGPVVGGDWEELEREIKDGHDPNTLHTCREFSKKK